MQSINFARLEFQSFLMHEQHLIGLTLDRSFPHISDCEEYRENRFTQMFSFYENESQKRLHDKALTR